MDETLEWKEQAVDPRVATRVSSSCRGLQPLLSGNLERGRGRLRLEHQGGESTPSAATRRARRRRSGTRA